jgi:tape measure domain-containing protein
MARYEDVFILKDKVSEKLTKISGNFNKVNEKINKTNTNLNNLSNTLTKVGGVLVAAFSLQKITQVANNISKLGMEFEDVRVDLETMLGSVEKADVMFKDIMTMAAKTPFESKDLLDATKQMLSFGIAEKDVIKYSKMLGDISGGNNERFRSLVLAFSQVSSVGKLQGQDKLQMINAGFNPLKEISKMTGKSMAQLDKEMSKGKISIDLVIKAITIAPKIKDLPLAKRNENNELVLVESEVK